MSQIREISIPFLNAKQQLQIVWYFLVFSILIPKITLGFLTLGTDDIVGLIALPYVLYLVFQRKFSNQIKINHIIIVWSALIFCGLFFGVFHALIQLQTIRIPTEMWQYFKRFVFFFLSIKFIDSKWISVPKALQSFIWMLLILLIIGLVQTTNTPIGNLLSEIYVTEVVQLEALKDSDAAGARNYSVTGFSTSWGGLCVLIVSIALAFLIHTVVPKGRRKLIFENRAMLLLILSLGLLNILLSGSRGAILALGFVVIAVVFMLLFGQGTLKSKLTKFFFITLTLAIGVGAIFNYMAEKIAFIQYRNEALLEAYEDGGNRFGDIEKAMTALSNPYWWTFGVSNAVQRALYVPYGVEVEPVYLLVNYGLLGIFLRYYILWLITRKSFSMLKYTSDFGDKTYKALGLSGILIIIGYLTFSVGYFFYQEAVVGCQPWIFFGIIVGIPFQSNNKLYVRN
jgi:hypothetical protein